jgi:hypothetical protein
MTEKELVWNKRVVKEKVKRKMIKEKRKKRNKGTKEK